MHEIRDWDGTWSRGSWEIRKTRYLAIFNLTAFKIEQNCHLPDVPWNEHEEGCSFRRSFEQHGRPHVILKMVLIGTRRIHPSKRCSGWSSTVPGMEILRLEARSRESHCAYNGLQDGFPHDRLKISFSKTFFYEFEIIWNVHSGTNLSREIRERLTQHVILTCAYHSDYHVEFSNVKFESVLKIILAALEPLIAVRDAWNKILLCVILNVELFSFKLCIYKSGISRGRSLAD